MFVKNLKEIQIINSPAVWCNFQSETPHSWCPVWVVAAVLNPIIMLMWQSWIVEHSASQPHRTRVSLTCQSQLVEQGPNGSHPYLPSAQQKLSECAVREHAHSSSRASINRQLQPTGGCRAGSTCASSSMRLGTGVRLCGNNGGHGQKSIRSKDRRLRGSSSAVSELLYHLSSF